jgi:hypothetical protein
MTTPHPHALETMTVQIAVEGYIVILNLVNGDVERHVFTQHKPFMEFIHEIVDTEPLPQ